MKLAAKMPRSSASIALAVVVAVVAPAAGGSPRRALNPSIPSPSITGSSSTSIQISWTAATPDPGRTISGYHLYLGTKNVVATVDGSTMSYTFRQLSCGTPYSLGVQAFESDPDGEIRSGIGFVDGKTSACADTTPPSTPTDLAVLDVTETSIQLGWKASTDDVGVTGYDPFLDGIQQPTTTDTRFTFARLTCGTSHRLGVRASDAASNHSGIAEITASTSPCAGDRQPPTAPTGLKVTSSGPTSIGRGKNTLSSNRASTFHIRKMNPICWSTRPPPRPDLADAIVLSR